MESTCSQTSMLTFSWASTVEAPRCGVATTFGWAISLVAAESCSGGSVLQTSMPAPARCPLSRASSRAASSIMPPRATFKIRAPFFILWSSLALIIPFVLAIRGVWMVRKSETARSSGREDIRETLWDEATAGEA